MQVLTCLILRLKKEGWCFACCKVRSTRNTLGRYTFMLLYSQISELSPPYDTKLNRPLKYLLQNDPISTKKIKIHGNWEDAGPSWYTGQLLINSSHYDIIITIIAVKASFLKSNHTTKIWFLETWCSFSPSLQKG